MSFVSTLFMVDESGTPNTVVDSETRESSEASNPMAAYSKVVSRLSSRLLQPSLTHSLTNTTSSELSSSLKSSIHFPAPLRRSAAAARISRLPLELSSVESMMPLHSAIASARLISSLSIESQSWGLVPQGISMPL